MLKPSAMILLLFVLMTSCNYQDLDMITGEVINPAALDRKDVLVTIDLNENKNFKIELADQDKITVYSERQQLTAQLNDLNMDGIADEVIFLIDLSAGQARQFIIEIADDKTALNMEKRTQAEISHKVGGKFEGSKYIGGKFTNTNYLRVPDVCTDHSLYIRYEGPGWESDKVGYRFYLDWRNAVDIYGKKTTNMVLQNVGQEGYDSYHEMSDWGMDILKVGNSLGIGSIGMRVDGKTLRVAQTDSVTCAILLNGNIQSKIRTTYYGWDNGKSRHDLVSDLKINAGSRLTECSLSLTNDPENICTGIVKHELAELIILDNKDSKYNYLATYGKQSLADDNLGMVIFYMNDDLIEITEDEESHIVVLKPRDGLIKYYFAAAWDKENEGIKDMDAFRIYLDNTLECFNNPVQVLVN